MTDPTAVLAGPEEDGLDEGAQQGEAPLRQEVHGRDAGMATAEYAIATLAACGFAGLLVTILKGNEVRGLLLGVVKSALAIG